MPERRVADSIHRMLERLLNPAPDDRNARVIVILVTVLLLFLRRPDGFLNPQLWAEDGTIFLAEDQLHGVSALWRTYQGYFHLLPRIVAYFGTVMGLRWTPALYNLAALAALIFVARYLLSSRIRLPNKGLMTLALVVCPHLGEVFMNLTNMQWMTSLALLLLVISEEPTGRKQAWFDLGVMVFVGLTGPFVAIVLPLFVARVALRRTAWSKVLLCAAALLSVVQGVGIDTDRNEGYFDPGDPAWSLLLGRSFAGLLLIGDMSQLARTSDVALLIASVALYVFFAGYCVVERKPAIALVLGGGLAIFGSAAYAYRGNPQELVDAIGVRYWYVPIVTLLWAASAGLSSRLAIAIPSGLIWMLALGSTMTMFATPRFTDYDWAASVACAEQQVFCTVPINPPGWSFTLWGKATGSR